MSPPSIDSFGGGVHGKVCWLIAYSRYFNSGVTVYRVLLSGDNCPPTFAHRQLPTGQLPIDNCPSIIIVIKYGKTGNYTDLDYIPRHARQCERLQ